MRTLLLIFAIWIIVMILRRQWHNKRDRPSTTESNKTGADSGKMVKCKQCGLHIPENEALRLEKDYFCSEFHLKQATKQNND